MTHQQPTPLPLVESYQEIIWLPYKEPLEPVDQGFGYKGTLGFTKDGSLVQCHICGQLFKNLGRHAYNQHELTSEQYKQRYQLSPRTALVSKDTSEKLRQSNLRQKQSVKEKRVAELKVNVKRNHDPKTGIRERKVEQSLEHKNKRGSCYYQLLDKIETLGKKLNKTPTKQEFINEYGGGFMLSVTRTFGTWNQALSLAGFTPNMQMSSRMKYSRDMVISSLRNFYEIEGRPPRASDMGDGIPGGSTIRHHFGGIIEARRAAGLGQYDYIHEMAER